MLLAGGMLSCVHASVPFIARPPSRAALPIVMSLSGGAAAAGDPRLSALRAKMAEAGVDAFVVPSNDPHLSEYVHPSYERRAFISDFTGSAGTAVITADEALLWTDGRYFLQAGQELGSEWTLMKALNPAVPSLESWLAEHLSDGSRVGIDPYVHSVDEATNIEKALTASKRELSLLPLYARPNLIDAVWSEATSLGLRPRPSAPTGAARMMPIKYTGIGCADKLSDMAVAARKAGAGAYLVGSLDEVCWLLNVRGSDVPMCPVLQSYVLLDCPDDGQKPSATLFVDSSKIPDDLASELQVSMQRGSNSRPSHTLCSLLAPCSCPLCSDQSAIRALARTVRGRGARSL